MGRVAVCNIESSLPAEGKIGVIPLSGHNGAKSDFRNDRVKRGQGFKEGGMPFSMADVYRSQWKGITPCISIARETVRPGELPRRWSGDARKFALQGARGVILCSSSALPPRSRGILRYRDKIRMNFFFFFSSSFFFVCVIKMAVESCFEMNFFYVSGYQKTVFSESRKNLQESWKERFTISDYLGLYHPFLIPLKIFPTSFPCFPRIDSLEKSSRDLTQVVSSIPYIFLNVFTNLRLRVLSLYFYQVRNIREILLASTKTIHTQVFSGWCIESGI